MQVKVTLVLHAIRNFVARPGAGAERLLLVKLNADNGS